MEPPQLIFEIGNAVERALQPQIASINFNNYANYNSIALVTVQKLNTFNINIYQPMTMKRYQSYPKCNPFKTEKKFIHSQSSYV